MQTRVIAALSAVAVTGALATAIIADSGNDPAPSSGTVTYSGLAPGQHTAEVRATDAAGNTDPTPASWTWTVQTPGTRSGTPQIELDFDNERTPAAEAAVLGAPAVQPSSIRWAINNVLKKTQTKPPFTYVNPPAGEYVLSVKALAPDGSYAITKQRVVR